MTLSNNELKKIQNFHKKMQKITGLKGNKFANKIMNKLLKNRSPWKRGGGTRNNQLGPPRGPNVDLVDDVGGYIERIHRTDRNQTINNATLVQLQHNGNLTAVERLAIQGNQRAINQVLLQARMNSIGQFLLRLLLTGMTLGGTYQTWHLFDNLTRVTRNTLDTVTPPTPAPPPSALPQRSYRNLFGLLGNGEAPAPAPVPQLPPPPEGWVSWMMNWAFSSGNNIIYRSRIVLAWFAEVLHDLVGTGQLAATIATFILLTIVSILILRMYENGVQVWIGVAGIDTREVPSQITNNTNPLPPLRRGTSDEILRRLQDTPGYRDALALEAPTRQSSMLRDRFDTTLRQRRAGIGSPRRSKSRKKKKKKLRNAAFSSGRNNSNFRFPPPPPPGTTSGGKRRKKKSRKRRRKRKSRRKRRKSRRKRKR